jgi:hypothetical protein
VVMMMVLRTRRGARLGRPQSQHCRRRLGLYAEAANLWWPSRRRRRTPRNRGGRDHRGRRCGRPVGQREQPERDEAGPREHEHAIALERRSHERENPAPARL